ncbi:uncharacterized protein LOC130255015 isoform X1 [Oenanthe melanoleuca]|uniref:uncharacterized protein LOC130255015 isoform X1 n=1 Tax=Oenanthe melanoleuca TaxID=2939378 RepID=UPI0024C18768|nr:uncharacterized protein LOC130255015 isoform X1 [Oenanthe melanoleuca]
MFARLVVPVGGGGWQNESLGRDYRSPCAGLGAGGRQCSPESWGDVGEISYFFSRFTSSFHCECPGAGGAASPEEAPPVGQRAAGAGPSRLSSPGHPRQPGGPGGSSRSGSVRANTKKQQFPGKTREGKNLLFPRARLSSGWGGSKWRHGWAALLRCSCQARGLVLGNSYGSNKK